MPKAIFPGSFDPPTNGHLDLVARGAALFPELTVLVAVNSRKSSIFTPAERVELLRAALPARLGVEVAATEGLVADYCRANGVSVILRGVRTVGDFEHERQMALTNRTLFSDVDTVFLVPGPEWSFLSSTLIREIAAAGGDVGRFVPPPVAAALAAKFPQNKRRQ